MSALSPRAADFGDPQAEARSLRQGCGVVERPAADRLELTGEDRQRFLNGQMTCDILALSPGRGTYGFFTTVKGRIEADATVLALEDRLLLVLPTGSGPGIRERLERYVIVDRVEISVPGPASRLTFIGPAAATRLESLLGGPPPEEVFAHAQVDVGGEPATVLREGRLGAHAWSLWLSPQAVEVVLKGIGDGSEGDLEARRVGDDAFEAYRIEVGMSRFGQDFGPENLPQETGIDEAEGFSAVSYTKGCYLGQEIVARLHYRGQVSRQLRLLEIPGKVPPSLPADLSLDGRSVGAMTSAAKGFSGGGLGIGWLLRRAFEPGTELEISTGGKAVVRALGA